MTVNEEEETTKNIVAIHFEKDKFGAAMYLEGQFQILYEDEKGINLDFMNKISLIEDKVLIISSLKSNLAALRRKLPRNTALQLIPSMEFISNNNEDYSLSIDYDDGRENSFKCLNALLMIMRKFDIFDQQVPIEISYFEIDSSKVVINRTCLQALQIFDFEPHPNMHAQQYGSKEGCSVYNIFNKAVTDEGKCKLKRWFLEPTNNISVLKTRQDSIAYILSNDSPEFINIASKSLKKCIKITNILNDLKFKPTAVDLLKISSFSQSFMSIQALAKNQEQLQSHHATNFPLLNTLKSENFSSISDLHTIISRIIDSERCKTSDIYMIKDSINPRLDDLRLKFRNLPDFLTEIVQLIAKQIKYHVAEVVNIVYFPQLGFLITLPSMSKEHDPKARGDQLGFQLQFQSDKICYYKNEKMRELDETIGDIYADIIDAQLDIMRKIVDEILKNEGILMEASDICSELDCLISMAKVAQMYSLTRPTIVEDPILQVEDGRHILVELYSENQCIANDCNLSEESSRMLLLTGANSSGKSVFLKQIGIIVYLTHIGSYVPARFAKIGLVDRILTRIKTNESSGKNESSFLIDLKQVREICETWTRKSLVLIDEFGKGTCEQDGMALFSGLLNYISRDKERSPRLIAITHMQEMFRNNFIPQENFKFAHMKIFMERNNLCYLYKLAEGIEDESYAIECAREAGISEKILLRAQAIKNALRQGASPEDLHLMFLDEEKLNEAIKLIKDS